jgi:hypothetical protein
LFFFNEKKDKYYGELFVHCLFEHNMLCWGVYRFIDSEVTIKNRQRPRSKRYVICSPDADFKLLPTDLIYVLKQFNNDYNKMYKNEKHLLRAPSTYDSKMLMRRRSKSRSMKNLLARNSTGNIIPIDIHDPRYYITNCIGMQRYNNDDYPNVDSV